MHRNPSRRRSTSRLLSLAAAAGLGTYFNTAPDPAAPPAGGGGGGANPPAKPPENEPAKIELTQAELDAKIEAARKAERDKTADAARVKREEDERKAAEEKGEFKALLEKEQGKTAALAAENRTLKVRIALADHLAEKHPAYAGSAKYIAPLIPPDARDADLPNAVAAAAAQFVKDNPRDPAAGGGGAPAAPPKTANRAPRDPAAARNSAAPANGDAAATPANFF